MENNFELQKNSIISDEKITDVEISNIESKDEKEEIRLETAQDKVTSEKSSEEKIANFLDDRKRIKIWPAKMELKLAVLSYLGTKFEEGILYSEKEVNEIVKEWHTFGDFFLLRRGLIDRKILLRAKDGSQYWKSTDITD